MEEHMNDQAQLCYVELPFVWFTTNFEGQSGDDWNDAPYECNAERPYQPDPSHGQNWKLFRVAVFANPYHHQLLVPEDGYYNSPWSVDNINKGDMPWLRLTNLDYDSPTIETVMAGTTYAEFKDFAYRYGLLLWSPGSIVMPRVIFS